MAKKENKKRYLITLDPKVVKKFKKLTIKKRISMSKICENGIITYNITNDSM